MENLAERHSSRPVATWLLVGVAMIIIQIILGGITRLTGSGLSITEWNVMTGTLPPLNEQQWLAEFQKYRQTPQYHLLNFNFQLPDFKFIFFWEWFHRLWARLIGIVFFIPFIIFLAQRRFRPEMIKPLVILFLLGALQGAIGWIMVASGLTGDATYVAPTRLALHFIFALGLLCYCFWFALQFMVPRERLIAAPSLRKLTWFVLFLLLCQLFYGSLMAGHKAATAAHTWPDINGSFIPGGLVAPDEGWLSLIENKITIHFIHRSLAYLILAAIIAWTIKARRFKVTGLVRKTLWLPLTIVSLQILLGIFSVLTSVDIVPGKWGVFEWMSQLHQLVAMLLLLSLVWMLFLCRNKINGLQN